MRRFNKNKLSKMKPFKKIYFGELDSREDIIDLVNSYRATGCLVNLQGFRVAWIYPSVRHLINEATQELT